MRSVMNALRNFQLSIAQYVALWISNGNYSIHKKIETVNASKLFQKFMVLQFFYVNVEATSEVFQDQETHFFK